MISTVLRGDLEIVQVRHRRAPLPLWCGQMDVQVYIVALDTKGMSRKGCLYKALVNRLYGCVRLAVCCCDVVHSACNDGLPSLSL